MARRVLMISHVPVFPLVAGNRIRIFNLIEQLRRFGAHVSFLHVTRMKGDREAMRRYFDGAFHEVPYKPPRSPRRLSGWRRVASRVQPQAYAFNSFADDWYDDSLQPAIAEAGAAVGPDVVLVEYVMMSKALECFSGPVVKLIDTHDVFANRYRVLQRAGLEPTWFSAFPLDEIRCLRRADRVIAIQRREAAYLRRFLGRRVVTVGHLAPAQPAGALVDRPRLVFVGGSNATNVDALRYFVGSILPQIRRGAPQAEFLVVGEVCRDIQDDPQVHKLGAIENLEDIYALADIFVNPCRTGTGLKTKNIEAMSFGKALVTTRHGAQGMRRAADHAFLMAGSAREFAAKTLALLNDVELRTSLAAAAVRFVRQWNAEQARVLRTIAMG